LDVSSPAKHEEYIVVCLGSSKSFCQWEPEKFVEVINRFIEKWRMPVYLSGGEIEQRTYQLIKEKFLYQDYIFDYANKTNFKQWVELIRAANLLISVDTGTVHLAAAVRTPSICIIGGWHYGILHPYKPDVMSSEDSPPICVFNKKSRECYSCASKTPGLKYGSGNPICTKEIQQGRSVLCVQEISVDEVMKEVDAFMKKHYINSRVK
jgi:ADP-heptose:LPS heptosyltransferase